MQSLKTGEVVKQVGDVSPYIYSKEELLHLIEQYELHSGFVKQQLDINLKLKHKGEFDKKYM